LDLAELVSNAIGLPLNRVKPSVDRERIQGSTVPRRSRPAARPRSVKVCTRHDREPLRFEKSLAGEGSDFWIWRSLSAMPAIGLPLNCVTPSVCRASHLLLLPTHGPASAQRDSCSFQCHVPSVCAASHLLLMPSVCRARLLSERLCRRPASAERLACYLQCPLHRKSLVTADNAWPSVCSARLLSPKSSPHIRPTHVRVSACILNPGLQRETRLLLVTPSVCRATLLLLVSPCVCGARLLLAQRLQSEILVTTANAWPNVCSARLVLLPMPFFRQQSLNPFKLFPSRSTAVVIDIEGWN